jgi:DNA-directed RNA polymerase subunit RPC12/RpoP
MKANEIKNISPNYRICKNCGSPFIPKGMCGWRQIHCSNYCRYKAFLKRKDEKCNKLPTTKENIEIDRIDTPEYTISYY